MNQSNQQSYITAIKGVIIIPEVIEFPLHRTEPSKTQQCCNTTMCHTMPFNTIRYHAMPFLNGILELSRGADSAKSTGNLIFLNKRGGNDQCRWHKFEFPERAQWVNISKYILKNKNISHISAAMKCFSPTTFLAQLFQIKAGLKM